MRKFGLLMLSWTDWKRFCTEFWVDRWPLIRYFVAPPINICEPEGKKGEMNLGENVLKSIWIWLPVWWQWLRRTARSPMATWFYRDCRIRRWRWPWLHLPGLVCRSGPVGCWLWRRTDWWSRGQNKSRPRCWIFPNHLSPWRHWKRGRIHLWLS